MKARAQRAHAQGISEADLPPVPRAVLEPPALPAPELHLKDAHPGRAARARGKTLGRANRHAKASKSHKVSKGTQSSKPTKRVAKAPRKSNKKGKG